MRDKIAITLCLAILLGLAGYFAWKHRECARQGLELVRQPLSGWACGKA